MMLKKILFKIKNSWIDYKLMWHVYPNGDILHAGQSFDDKIKELRKKIVTVKIPSKKVFKLKCPKCNQIIYYSPTKIKKQKNI